MTLTFKFELDRRHMHHMPEKSRYNHNYYKLDLLPYGDCILLEKCNVLFERCEDDCYESYYSLGYFDENDEFQAMWTWLDKYKMELDGVKGA